MDALVFLLLCSFVIPRFLSLNLFRIHQPTHRQHLLFASAFAPRLIHVDVPKQRRRPSQVAATHMPSIRIHPRFIYGSTTAPSTTSMLPSSQTTTSRCIPPISSTCLHLLPPFSLLRHQNRPKPDDVVLFATIRGSRSRCECIPLRRMNDPVLKLNSFGHRPGSCVTPGVIHSMVMSCSSTWVYERGVHLFSGRDRRMSARPSSPQGEADWASVTSAPLVTSNASKVVASAQQGRAFGRAWTFCGDGELASGSGTGATSSRVL